MRILPTDGMLKMEERTRLVVPDAGAVDEAFASSFAADFPGVTTESGSVAGGVASFLGRANRESVATTALVCNQMNLVHAAGSALDDIASLFGIARHAKTATRARLTFTGTEGALVPAGTEVTNDDNSITFRTEDSVTIPESGTASVYAYNTVKGAVEVGSGVLVNLVSAASGIESVTNAEGEKGRDEETDEQLRIRVYLQRYSGQALLESIRSGILATDGVNSCWCEENRTDRYSVSSASGLDPAKFKGFAVASPENGTSYGIAVYAGKKTGQQMTATETLSGSGTEGDFVLYRTAKGTPAAGDTRRYMNVAYVWKVVSSTANSSTYKWVKAEGAVTLRPHSIWCVVSGGSEGDIASALFAKKSSGSDYSALSESVPAADGREALDITVPLADPANGMTHAVRFTRPEEVSYSVEVDVIRHNYAGSDEDLRNAIRAAITQWQLGNVFGVDGLSVGDSIYSCEVGAAVSEKIPEVKIKSASIVEIGSEIVEQFDVKAKCVSVSVPPAGAQPAPETAVYAVGTSYDVKVDGSLLYLDYSYTEGGSTVSSKNHFTLVGNEEGTDAQGKATVTPRVSLMDTAVSQSLPTIYPAAGKYANYHKETTVVGQTGFKSYTTLEAAWNDADDGQIVTQREDDAGVTAAVTLDGGKTVTLDMNGKSFSSTSTVTVKSGSTLRICNNKTVTNRTSGRAIYSGESKTGTEGTDHNGWFSCAGIVADGTVEVNGANVDTNGKSISGYGKFQLTSGYVLTKQVTATSYVQNCGRIECTSIGSSVAVVSGGYLIASSSGSVFTKATAVIRGGYVKGGSMVGRACSISGGAIVDVTGGCKNMYAQKTGSGKVVYGGQYIGVQTVYLGKNYGCCSSVFTDYPEAATFWNTDYSGGYYFPSAAEGGIYYTSSVSGILYEKDGYSFSSFFSTCAIRRGAQQMVMSPMGVSTAVDINGDMLQVDAYGNIDSLAKDTEIYLGENGLPDLPEGLHRTYEFDIEAKRRTGVNAKRYPVSGGGGEVIMDAGAVTATASEGKSDVNGLTMRRNAYTSPYGIAYEQADVTLVNAGEVGAESAYNANTGVADKRFLDELLLKPYQIGSISTDNIGALLEDE